MAGAGYKVFTAGAVLTASEVNTYLMDQSVQVYAGTAARGSAVAAPSEGMMSYRTDDDVLETYVTANGVSQWVESNKLGSRGAANVNMIYNGAMQIAQRGTSTASITGGVGKYYTADRWAIEQNTGATTGTWTQSIEADAPTGSGFRNSLKMLCTTGTATLTAGSYLAAVQYLEGQDVQRMKKGTSSAEKVTLSFWVKTNVTGTYVVELNDNDNTRQVSASYSIAAGDSGNWVKRVITFPADTTGAFDNDNAKSLQVYFWLAAGSTFSSGTLNTSWAAVTNANRVAGQTSVAAATNNYWQVTGVQLEIGNAASPFEFEPYDTTLRKCQRYYYRNNASQVYSVFAQGRVDSGTLAIAMVNMPVAMRSAPTSLDYNTASSKYTFNTGAGGATVTGLALSTNCHTPLTARLEVTVSGLTAGHGGFLWSNNNTDSYIGLVAEL